MPWRVKRHFRKGFRKLEQYDIATGITTGVIKDNLPHDPDYVQDIQDSKDTCGPETDIITYEGTINVDNIDYELVIDKTGVTLINDQRIYVGMFWWDVDVDAVGGPDFILFNNDINIQDTDPDVQTIVNSNMPARPLSDTTGHFDFRITQTDVFYNNPLLLEVKVEDVVNGITYFKHSTVLYSDFLDYDYNPTHFNWPPLEDGSLGKKIQVKRIAGMNLRFTVRIRQQFDAI